MKYQIAAAAAALCLTGCAGAAFYVSADDPVLAVCQQPAVAGISTLQAAVGSANDTNPDMPGAGQALVSGQVIALRQAAAAYRQYAGQVAAGHPRFAVALRNTVTEFSVVASSPTRLTTDSVARAADASAGQVTSACSSFRVGRAPAHGRPGPGVWDWGLFWAVTGGYLIAVIAASWVIAAGQRTRPRASRLSPQCIIALSFVWWATIFTAAWRAWKHFIATASLTPDERKDDRIAAQQAEIAQLEEQLSEGKKKQPSKGKK